MIPIQDREFLAALCLARAGLKVDAEKSYLIESRMGPLARREGYDSPEAFIESLRTQPNDRQAWAAVEAMALSETGFFRDRGVFDKLEREVLPDLVRARAGGAVRIWSTACGSGQEVYSLGMLLADAPHLADRVELFASDLSKRSLEKAQAGLYSQFEVQRGLPARRLVRYFENRGDLFALSPRIKQMVRWRRVNLLDDLSRFGQFDLILCRYVLSSLAPDARSQVVAALRGALAPGGRLVLGLKEPGGDGLDAVDPSTGFFAPAEGAIRSAA
jgi:chemotaxis protein methyltransferase CheR